MRRVLLVLVLTLAACGKDDVRPSLAGEPTTTTAPTTTTTAVALPVLPAYGLVLDATEQNASGDGPTVAVVVDLEGHELARLDGWRANLGWIENPSGTAYEVDATTHALVPTSSTGQPDAIDLPLPPGMPPDVGHWENAFAEPNGDRILATWSAECESPTAYVVEGDRSMRPVRGTDPHVTPEAVAFGWAPDGRAVVSFFPGGCGDAWQPGTYLIDLDNAAATPTRVSPYYYGFLWTSAT